MKLQSLAIIFIIIVFPMILALSYYISLQIDTVTLYNKYNNELIDATNDAMSAFELNTANEELSNVSDSLRSIVDASTNTFINTLSTSLGLSNVNKNDIEPYIPSILYTMYDGYYIYSPTETPVVLEKVTEDGDLRIVEGAEYDTDGSLLYKRNEYDEIGTPNVSEAMKKTDYVLKSYMPYSATYVQGTNTATINYTLDNFMSISAQIGDIYYTKTGYYIDTTLVNNFNTNWGNSGQDELLEFCKSGQSVSITLKDGTIINYTPIREILGDPSSRILSIEESEKKLESLYKDYQGGDTSVLGYIRNLEVELANNKAITYYLTNTAFSNWVNDNLGFVTGNNLQTVIDFDNPDNIGYSLENMNAMYHNFQGEGQVFAVDSDPENDDSTFNNHKYNIIKNSIQYNLNLAISSYSNMFEGLSFEMPQLSDTQWQEITEKISIISFMQGLDCGLKEFNGYAIVSSTNNEMTVIPEEIYYVKAGEFNNENSYYHRIDCETIREETGDFIYFKSKEVKYDDIYKGEDAPGDGYEYDHKNLACYDCIVQNNYSNFNDGTNNKKIKLRAFLDLENDTNEGFIYRNTSVNPNLKKAYLIAVAKERQNLYKTTQYSKNEGIQTFNSVSSISIPDYSEVDKFEITLQVDTPDYARIVDNLRINGDDATEKAISTTTSANQTVEINNNNYSSIDIACENSTLINILSIKVVYK